MKNARLNPAYRSNERKSDADRKRQKRLDPGVRQHEQQTDTARRANTRQNPDVLEHEREQRAIARLDPGVLEHEREQRTIARNNLQNSKTVQDLIKEFHEAVEQGPVLSCYVCNTIQYPYNVVELTADSLPNCGAVSECTADAPAGSWLCKSCQRYLKQKEYPPMSAANGMVFPVIPENFKDTRELEWSLASPRKAFMKIFAAPRGEQHVIRGNVVNVPFNVNETVQSLPRLPNDHETIQVEIKRDLRYKNVVMSQAVRPERVRGVAQYLCSQQLFREQNITYDNSWALDSAPESEVPEDRGSELLEDVQSSNQENLQNNAEDSSSASVNPEIDENETLHNERELNDAIGRISDLTATEVQLEQDITQTLLRIETLVDSITEEENSSIHQPSEAASQPETNQSVQVADEAAEDVPLNNQETAQLDDGCWSEQGEEVDVCSLS